MLLEIVHKEKLVVKKKQEEEVAAQCIQKNWRLKNRDRKLKLLQEALAENEEGWLDKFVQIERVE